MAGHSHWNNIQRRKGAVDAKRAKIWGKIAKKIMIAAKSGPDPRENLSLRYIIDEAKAANMPKDTIQKAVDKGSGQLGTENFEEITYEAYGPGGVAMIVEALTDNRARTAPDLRSLFDRSCGNLATSGSVSFMFNKCGIFIVKGSEDDEEKLMNVSLEAGAEDVRFDDGIFEIISPVTSFHTVKTALEEATVTVEDAQITHIPTNTVALDADVSRRFEKLLDQLDDNDDVQNVYHNAELTE